MPATNDDFADEAQDKDDCDEDDKDYKRKQQQMHCYWLGEGPEKVI